MRTLWYFRCLPLLVVAQACSTAELVERDLLRAAFLKPSQRSELPNFVSRRDFHRTLLRTLACRREARTVLYYRLRSGTRAERVARALLEYVYPGQVGVEISCPDIGPGFALGHGQASVIWATRIGADCTIYQHCTLGLIDGRADSAPVLGDRVWIWPGGKIIGADLGDDTTVGAGAVVLSAVPAGCTAVGVPAVIIQPAAGVSGA